MSKTKVEAASEFIKHDKNSQIVNKKYTQAEFDKECSVWCLIGRNKHPFELNETGHLKSHLTTVEFFRTKGYGHD